MAYETLQNAARSPDEIFDDSQARSQVLRTQIISSDTPVYAVLDGAGHEDLPDALYRADLISCPLYKDRGGGPRDFDQTAPQLVRLDVGSEGTRDMPAQSPKARVVERLWSIYGDFVAGVFWFSDSQTGAFFRHLRGLGMVRVPATSLPQDRQISSADETEMLLFRHADPNAMAQVVPCLDEARLHRMMGPAYRLAFVPTAAWSFDESFDFARTANLEPGQTNGALTFDPEIMTRIEERRDLGVLRHLLLKYIQFHTIFGDDYQTLVMNAHIRAASYGIERLPDFELFVETECEFGPDFEHLPGHERAMAVLNDTSTPAPQRVFYARKACLMARDKTP